MPAGPAPITASLSVVTTCSLQSIFSPRGGRNPLTAGGVTPSARRRRRPRGTPGGSHPLAAALDDRVGEAGECLFHRPVRERCEGDNGLGSPAMCFGEGAA